jgi:hypothetical protein
MFAQLTNRTDTVDYPVFTYDLYEFITFVVPNVLTGRFPADWHNKQISLSRLAADIETQRVTKDRDRLLSYLDYEIPVLTLRNTAQEQYMLALIELVNAPPKNGAPLDLIDYTQRVIGDFAKNTSRLAYYEYLQELYSSPRESRLPPALNDSLNQWMRDLSILWEDTVTAKTISFERDMFGIIVASEIKFSPPGLSRTARLFPVLAAMMVTFGGLVLSLLWVFGKKALSEEVK